MSKRVKYVEEAIFKGSKECKKAKERVENLFNLV